MELSELETCIKSFISFRDDYFTSNSGVHGPACGSMEAKDICI